MKAYRRIICAALIVSVFAVLLSGCVPIRYTKSHEQNLCDKGKALMEDYLTSTAVKARLGDVICLHATHYTGDYLTDITASSYSLDGRTVEIAADVHTGEIYTSELYDELKTECEARAKTALGLKDEDIISVEANPCLSLVPTRDGEVITELPEYIKVDIRMLPAGMTDIDQAFESEKIEAEVSARLEETADIESLKDITDSDGFADLPFTVRNINLESFREYYSSGADRYERFATERTGDLIVRFSEYIEDTGYTPEGEEIVSKQSYEFGKDLTITGQNGEYLFDVKDTSPEFNLFIYTETGSPISGMKGTFEREDGQKAELLPEEEPLKSGILRFEPSSFFPLDVTGTLTFK